MENGGGEDQPPAEVAEPIVVALDGSGALWSEMNKGYSVMQGKRAGMRLNSDPLITAHLDGPT